MNPKMDKLKKLATLIRYLSLLSTTRAGSGHPTSSLSAADLMTVLVFGGIYRFDLKNPLFENNDRLIFSKGHASPLFYSLYAAAGAISVEELMTLRKFGSRLEGHPTMFFPYTEAATGSLGQGLSIGVGMAINAKYLDKLPYNTFVLLGDSEMAEGSVWEAIQSAAYYKLDNLVAVLDVNRLGQRGQTQFGHDIKAYAQRVKSFGWETILIDGHNLSQIKKAFKKALKVKNAPVMVITKTLKGKGVSFLEDKDNWHGKALNEEQLQNALSELGKVNLSMKGNVSSPQRLRPREYKVQKDLKSAPLTYNPGDLVATRKAYGNALVRIFHSHPNLVVLDAEVSNSTYSELFKNAFPERFFEMFIAEQNMIGVALGLSRRGKIPFASTFAAFFARGFDQIRMSQYSKPNIKFVGSHAGVSIGEDGASQMALEDIASFRAVLGMAVLYPADALSADKLTEAAANHIGSVYIRTTRMETPVIYSKDEKFEIGGLKIHKNKDQMSKAKGKVLIIGAGVTLFEALKAQKMLAEEGINATVVDLYSLKPLDEKTLKILASSQKAVITVEDHYLEGGIGEAVSNTLSDTNVKVYKLAVKKMPKSGKPDELLNYEEINTAAIIKKALEVI